MELFGSLEELNRSRRGTSRRIFLFSGVGMVVSWFGYRWWRDRARPIQQIKTRYITPNPEFYLTQIDAGFTPSIRKDNWQLSIKGMEGKSFSLGYGDMLKLEQRRLYRTFACVGNEVGGPAIGNAEWTATPLRPLLERVLGSRREGLTVMFRAMDGFYSSVPLEVALSDQSFIAYEMNGVELPKRHGWPARVLLPGIYGMKQPRWLERIELSDSGVTGYWERRGWCSDCTVKMTARVDSAMKKDDGKWLVTGMAYCGAQSVGAVEFSADDGETWRQVQITSERHANAWVTWETTWQPAAAGEHVLSARVIDGSGERQIESNDGSFPSGATGIHRVIVNV